MAVSAFSISSLAYPLNTQKIKIGIAVSVWNGHITKLLTEGANAVLIEAGLQENQIETIYVPGAFELPIAAGWMLNKDCDAVICLGSVVRGETPHFEYVCQATTDGILKVGLDCSKPCIFGVLTTESEAQALDRCGGKHGHKGREAAETALWMLALKQKLNVITDLY